MVLRTFRARSFKARTFAPIIGLPQILVPIPPSYYTISGGVSGKYAPDKTPINDHKKRKDEDMLLAIAFYVVNILDENNNYV